jgi:hypothetical protein
MDFGSCLASNSLSLGLVGACGQCTFGRMPHEPSLAHYQQGTWFGLVGGIMIRVEGVTKTDLIEGCYCCVPWRFAPICKAQMGTGMVCLHQYACPRAL